MPYIIILVLVIAIIVVAVRKQKHDNLMKEKNTETMARDAERKNYDSQRANSIEVQDYQDSQYDNE